jgi:hypothetical protein
MVLGCREVEAVWDVLRWLEVGWGRLLVPWRPEEVMVRVTG